MRLPLGVTWKPRSATRCGATPKRSPGSAATRPARSRRGPFAAGRVLHLARLSAIRRIRQALGAAERAEAAAAIGHGATYPMLAAAAAMARQTAWKRYRPGRSPDRHSTGKGAAPGAAVTPEVTKGILADSLLRPCPFLCNAADRPVTRIGTGS